MDKETLEPDVADAVAAYKSAMEESIKARAALVEQQIKMDELETAASEKKRIVQDCHSRLIEVITGVPSRLMK